MVSGLIDFFLAILALPATFCCAYLASLTLLSGPLAALVPSSRRLRFDVIVPAHDEESGIARTVSSLLAMNWPADRFRVLVVADNCNDATATVAQDCGARVLERHDLNLRGKGYALGYAFEFSMQDGFASVVVVVDADAEVSSNLLEAFAARIERGARAVQAHYGILNPWASWRTQLITIATGAFHVVRSRARERMGLSCGIRGNGWCVTHELLREVPYCYYSLSEDVEYGIALGLAGCRVEYAGEAHADADMAASEKNARTQRQRWETGRFQLARSNTLPLLRAAIRRRSLVLLDLAFDLIVLPLSYVVMNIVLLGVVAAVLGWWLPSAAFWVWWALVCAGVLALHVLRGWQVSGMGIRCLWALVHVPGFILWRIKLLLGRKTNEWVRTERERS